MTTYNSIQKIKHDFNIDSSDLEIIREKLNEIRITNHPDKTKGKFENDKSEENYHNANNAIEYIDNLKNNQSLIVVEKMTDLMKIVTELIPNNKQNSLETNLDSKISFAISNFRSKLFLPKISLTAITAIVTFLFLFPTQIKDNPIISHYIDPTHPGFAFLWLILVSYSALFWIITYRNEERAKRKLAFLKVDSTQNRLFEKFIDNNLYNEREFTKDNLTHFIYNGRMGDESYEKPLNNIFNSLNLFGSEIITIEIAQNIAELIINRAEKNNIVQKVSRTTLSDTYEIKNYR